MKGMIHTLGALAVISAVLGARAATSCSDTSAGHGARVAMADTEHAQHGAAPAGAAKAQIGDEVACAVDGMKMRLSADTPSAEYGGKTYYFCSASEKESFLQHPERYVGR